MLVEGIDEGLKLGLRLLLGESEGSALGAPDVEGVSEGNRLGLVLVEGEALGPAHWAEQNELDMSMGLSLY